MVNDGANFGTLYGLTGPQDLGAFDIWQRHMFGAGLKKLWTG